MATVLVPAEQGVHESDVVFQKLPAGQSHAHSLFMNECVGVDSQVEVADESRNLQDSEL